MSTDVLDCNDATELCSSVAAHVLHAAAQTFACLLMDKIAVMQWSSAAAWPPKSCAQPHSLMHVY